MIWNSQRQTWACCRSLWRLICHLQRLITWKWSNLQMKELHHLIQLYWKNWIEVPPWPSWHTQQHTWPQSSWSCSYAQKLEEVQAEVSLQWKFTLTWSWWKNKEMKHWVIFTTVDKTTYKLGSKIQYFGMLNYQFYCRLLCENSLRETGTSVTFWR